MSRIDLFAGNIESDDITCLVSEMEKALNYSKKVSMVLIFTYLYCLSNVADSP